MLRYSEGLMWLGLLIIRVGVGVAFVIHGLPKLTGGPQAWEGIGMSMGAVGIHFLPVFWGFMAAVAEFFGGVCLALGLFTRVFSLLLAITMAVAVMFHLSKGQGFMEASHALELGVVFLGFLFTGPGRISLDRAIFPPRG